MNFATFIICTASYEAHLQNTGKLGWYQENIAYSYLLNTYSNTVNYSYAWRKHNLMDLLLYSAI